MGNRPVLTNQMSGNEQFSLELRIFFMDEFHKLLWSNCYMYVCISAG